MKRNGNLLWITALHLTRVFKVAVKTVQKYTGNDKSFNLTRYSTVRSFWSFVFLLNTKRCFVGRDFIHFSVRTVDDISPWSLGFSPGRLPWGRNDSGAGLRDFPRFSPAAVIIAALLHIHLSSSDCRYDSNVLDFRLGVSFQNSISVPVLGYWQSGRCDPARPWEQCRLYCADNWQK